MTQIKTPRAFNEFFNDNRDMREIQKWFTDFSRTTPTVISEGTTVIITEDTNQNASQAGITIDASLNDVRYYLKAPGVYKGKIYRIDVKDDTNIADISGIINGVDQNFRMYADESIIIQDNGTSWRVK
jgi:hypothetical protein